MSDSIRSRVGGSALAAASLAALAALAPPAAHGTGTDAAPLLWDDFESGSLCFWPGRSGDSETCLYDFSCFGDTPPAGAVDPLLVSGTLVDQSSLAPIAGAAAEARLAADSSLLDSDTTAADGGFALAVPTGGVPVDAFLSFAASSYPTTRYFSSDPFAADLVGAQFQAVTTSQLAFLYFVANVAQLPGTGTAVVAVVDCAGTPIAGATVALTPAPAALRYLAGSLPSSTATATDASGVALGLSAPAGAAMVTASYGGHPLEAHASRLFAAGVSGTPIHP